MLFASLINHHAVHQIQVPHGNFISYGEKTDRGRVTYFFFLFPFPPFFSSLFLFGDACENCWPVWHSDYFHGLVAHDWHTCLNQLLQHKKSCLLKTKHLVCDISFFSPTPSNLGTVQRWQQQRVHGGDLYICTFNWQLQVSELCSRQFHLKCVESLYQKAARQQSDNL